MQAQEKKMYNPILICKVVSAFLGVGFVQYRLSSNFYVTKKTYFVDWPWTYSYYWNLSSFFIQLVIWQIEIDIMAWWCFEVSSNDSEAHASSPIDQLENCFASQSSVSL